MRAGGATWVFEPEEGTALLRHQKLIELEAITVPIL
jgi:hypothetical protein